ncbi:MAG: hypothetical protein ACR2NB_06595 [Solirubrobacteraceae bacterium]
MRTTLTLDDDVAEALTRRRRESGRRLKDEINELLRLGLLTSDRRPTSPPGRTPTLALGPSRVGPLDDVAGVLARLDEE